MCFQSLVSHCNWPSAKCQNPSSPQFNNNRPRSSSANIVDRSVRPVSIHCGIACCFRVWRQRQKVSISLYQSALTQDKSTETTTAQHRQALYVYILYFFIWKVAISEKQHLNYTRCLFCPHSDLCIMHFFMFYDHCCDLCWFCVHEKHTNIECVRSDAWISTGSRRWRTNVVLYI